MTSAVINTVSARVINTQEVLLIFPTEIPGVFQSFTGLVGETLPGANGTVIFVPQNRPAPPPTTAPTANPKNDRTNELISHRRLESSIKTSLKIMN
ncbi:MAG: hypothetical protein RLZZ532_3485 [Cyanobacteriota bacterium]